MSESTVDRDPFERLAEEFAERLRRGEHPSLTEYVARCPEHADDIRELFPALALVEQYNSSDDSELVVLRRHRRHRATSPSAWATTGSSAISARAAWASFTRPCASRSTATSRSRSCTPSSATVRSTCAGSAPRPARRPGCTTPTSSASSTTASQDGVCYYAMQYIAGQSLDKILVDVRQLRKEKTGFAAAEAATLALRPDGRRDARRGRPTAPGTGGGTDGSLETDGYARAPDRSLCDRLSGRSVGRWRYRAPASRIRRNARGDRGCGPDGASAEKSP